MRKILLDSLNEKLLTSIDWVIHFYQKYVSSLFPPSCRFEPTCSQYARDSLKKYGFLRGLIKSVWRVLRCHPYSRGGYDPA